MITPAARPPPSSRTPKASPYIKDLWPTRRFVSALVMIDFDTAAQWAQAQRIFTRWRSLVGLPVREL